MQINNLKEQHRKINSLIEEIDMQITNKDFPSNSQDIAKNISQLAGVLKIHLGSEDKFLYPRLKTTSDIEIRTLAERYDREMGDLSQAYSEFKDKYNTKSKLNADSVAFKNEYSVIVELLKTRITKEDNELYPIAEKL